MTVRRMWARRLLAGSLIGFGAALGAWLLAEGAVEEIVRLAGQMGVATYLLTGLLLVERRPGHRVGDVLFGGAVCFGVLQLGDAWVRLPGAPPGSSLVAALVNNGELLLFPILAGLFVIFPDGRPLSRRWGWLVAATAVAAATAFVALALEAGPLSYYTGFVNVLGVPGFPGREIGEPAYALVAIGLGTSASALVVRWQRSGPVVRAQLKWVALAALAIGGFLAAGLLVPDTRARSVVAPLGLVVAGLILAVSIAIAILRYRLYDIDRLISRTLSWAVITGILLAVFAGAVVMLQAILAGLTQGQTLAVAASTLLAFALTQPLRRRVQAAVDRRFDRARYDGNRAAAAFAERLRGKVELGAIEGDLATTAAEALSPASCALWVRGSRP
jgi:hypothetical protein